MSAGPLFRRLRAALAGEEPVALCTVTEGPNLGAKLLVPGDEAEPVLGSLGDAELDRVVERDARGLLGQALTELVHYGAHGEARMAEVAVFVESFALFRCFSSLNQPSNDMPCASSPWNAKITGYFLLASKLAGQNT